MTPELADIEMAAHGGSVLEVAQGRRPLAGGAGQPATRAGSRAETRDGDHRPGRRPRAAEDHGRPHRHQGARHAQQLRRRHDALGHLAHRPRRTSTATSGARSPTTIAEAASLQALRRARQAGTTGAAYHDRFDITKEPNEPQPLRLDGRDRPVRPDLDAQEAHRARPLQARGCRRRSSTRTAGSSSTWATTSASTTSTSSSPPARFDPSDRAANMDLLDEGTLSVARFNDDGTLDWLPLVHGQGPLTEAENGFTSQADVLIEARLRRRPAVGATKMDRPEDVERQPEDQQGLRDADQQHTPQGRAGRRRQPAARRTPFGHIVEMTPPDGDHAADKFAWDILVHCGDPDDRRGRRHLQLGHDQGRLVRHARQLRRRRARAGCGSPPTATTLKATGRTDGVWAIETEGEARGTSQALLPRARSAPRCAARSSRPTTRRCSSPSSTRARRTATASPAPSRTRPTRWPDFKDGMPPRPSIVVITKEDGGVIGA